MRPVTHVDRESGRVTRSKVTTSTRCGKQVYSSMKVAKAKAKASSKASGDQIEAYHCYTCHGAHLGHVPGSERAGDRARAS